jgi:hypothetical protein
MMNKNYFLANPLVYKDLKTYQHTVDNLYLELLYMFRRFVY